MASEFELFRTELTTQILGKQLLYTRMMLEEIAIEEGEHRLLTLIHYLMGQKNCDNKKLDITKQQLADMSGLRVETVIRIMKKVEDKGMIETTGCIGPYLLLRSGCY